jgi:hypothetical protein
VRGLDPASIVAISGVAAGGAGGGQAAETTPVFDVRINYIFDVPAVSGKLGSGSP